jgi:hypothetical protein
MNQPRNILLTGVPRSGTSLTCRLLGHLPNTLALQEPMQTNLFGQMGSFSEIKKSIDLFFEEMRKSALEKGEVITFHIDGIWPDNYFPPPSRDSGFRKRLAKRGFVTINKEITPEMTMIIKHPQAFTALIPQILQFYPMFVIIRNPLWSLASWNSTHIPSRKGRSPDAEPLDQVLASNLEKIEDLIDRQIYMISWMFEKYSHVDAKYIIRYEEIIDSHGKCLEKIIPEAKLLNETLYSENRPERYPNVPLEELRQRLIKTGGAFFDFYSPSDLA